MYLQFMEKAKQLWLDAYTAKGAAVSEPHYRPVIYQLPVN
jgi:hypothetical protein